MPRRRISCSGPWRRRGSGSPEDNALFGDISTRFVSNFFGILPKHAVAVLEDLCTSAGIFGEDDQLHTSAASGGVAGPGGFASWYYDADGDGHVDQNGTWGSYFANVADPAWRAALRTYRNDGTEGWYEYLIHTLGCDGLFLDTVDTVAPAAWSGPYSGEITAMIDLIAEIRAALPS